MPALAPGETTERQQDLLDPMPLSFEEVAESLILLQLPAAVHPTVFRCHRHGITYPSFEQYYSCSCSEMRN